MKDYKLTHQFYIYRFFKKTVSKVAPSKVENTKMLTDDERSEIIRRIQKKYNLNEKQILKYLEMNLSCPDVLKLFLEIEGLEDKYEEYETKCCSKSAMYHHLCYFLIPLILLVSLNVIIGLFAYQPVGYIVMASLDVISIPFIAFEFIRFLKIYSFVKDEKCQTEECNKMKITNCRPVFAFAYFKYTPRHNRFYTLLYLSLNCEVGGTNIKMLCFLDDMNNVFPAERYFAFGRIIKSLSKKIKGKTISGKYFIKHNVLVGKNKKIAHLINSSWDDAK